MTDPVEVVNGSVTLQTYGTTAATLEDLNDDTLIHIFGFMNICDILAMRQVSKRMHAVSKLRIVWQRALETHVLDRGFPFPVVDTDSIDCAELETWTRRAHNLGLFWQTPTAKPQLAHSFLAGNSATGVAEVRFLPARPNCLITLSKGIWSVITCWHIGSGDSVPRKVAEWSPRQALITSLVVNSDPHSDACLAISLTSSGESQQSGAQLIQILGILFPEGQTDGSFVVLRTIPSSFRVMTLQGELLAASDDINETHIINWERKDYAVLWGSDEPSEHNFQHNRCLQVVFAPRCVFVVRARSLEVFIEPTLLRHEDTTPAVYNRPTASHRFGWIDGVSMSVQKQSANGTGLPPLSIVLRPESDDPWASDVHTVDLYTFQPNPAFDLEETAPWTVSDESCGDETDHSAPNGGVSRRLSPYRFPPVRQASWVSKRGHLRCRDILVGTYGTAVWIQPRPARNLDLTAFDVHSSDTQRPGSSGGLQPAKERLVAALLPGKLRDSQEHSDSLDDVRTLWTFEGTNGMWTSVDYDEARGLIALGDSRGVVDVLSLQLSSRASSGRDGTILDCHGPAYFCYS